MIVNVTYYDGESASSHRGTLAEVGDTFLLSDHLEGSRKEFVFKSRDIETALGEDEYLLTSGNFTIILQKEDFKKLKISRRNFWGLYLKIGVAGSLTFLFLLLNMGRIVEVLSDLVPESVVNRSVEETHSMLKGLHCLSKDQDAVIEGVFLRLGKNQNEYSIYVISSNDENAFAVPGKIIVFHDSLLRGMSSMDGFAGVLAHEIAHLDKNHIKKKVVKDLIMEAGFYLLFSSSKSQVFLKEMAKGNFSQEEEREADLLAMGNLKEAEINSTSMVDFFTRQKAKENPWLRFLSTSHPDYEDRIKVFNGAVGKTRVFPAADWALLQTGCPTK